MMNGEMKCCKKENKEGEDFLFPFIRIQSSNPSRYDWGLEVWEQRLGDGAGELFRVSSSPKMHLNAGWFHAYRPWQARTHFHQLTASIRKPFSLRRLLFSPHFTSITFSQSLHAAHVGLTRYFYQSCFIKPRMLSQHVWSRRSELLTWRKSFSQGHCYLVGNISGFAFSCEFPFTEIMELNDLPQEALILNIH